jgi:hypothetical protein
MMSKSVETLKQGMGALGTNSREIYEKYAEKYNWDLSVAGNFGRQGATLFANQCADNGTRSVWAISHSNLTDTKVKHWKNEFNSDCSKIKATGNNLSKYFDIDAEGAERIIFAKKKVRGAYEFLGVYTLTDHCTIEGITYWIYTRISTEYPVK